MFQLKHLSLFTRINSVAVAALAILFTTTKPDSLPIALIVAVMAAIVWLVFALVRSVLGLAGFEGRRQIALSVASTSIIGMIIILQAAGQLTLRDFLGFVTVFIIGYLYVSRFSVSR